MYGTTAGKTAHIFKELWKKTDSWKTKEDTGAVLHRIFIQY